MRVLLDECIDWRLSRSLVGHEVRTVRQMGWTGITNGRLLALAAQAFDVFITVDRNLSSQQNLSTFDIAVVVLLVRSIRLRDILALLPDLLDVIPTAKRGAVTQVGN